MQRRAAVLIADDHPLVSHGLRELLRSTYTVVGTVGDGREVRTRSSERSPDVLLLDLSMPHRNGLDLIPELVAAFPSLRILVVTMHLGSHARRSRAAGRRTRLHSQGGERRRAQWCNSGSV